MLHYSFKVSFFLWFKIVVYQFYTLICQLAGKWLDLVNHNLLFSNWAKEKIENDRFFKEIFFSDGCHLIINVHKKGKKGNECNYSNSAQYPMSINFFCGISWLNSMYMTYFSRRMAPHLTLLVTSLIYGKTVSWKSDFSCDIFKKLPSNSFGLLFMLLR